MKKPIIIAIVSFIIFTAFLFFFKTKETNIKNDIQNLEVRTVKVKRGNMKVKKSFHGKIISKKSTMLQSEILGKIVYIKEDGSKVKKGEIIILLNNEEAIAKLKTAQAHYDNELMKLNNMEKLLKEACISQNHYDEQKFKVAEAHGRLLEAQVFANRHKIEAPFNGVLGLAQENLGSCVKQNTNLITITDIGHLQLELTLSEEEIQQLGGIEKIKHMKVQCFVKNNVLPIEAVYKASEMHFDQDTNSITLRFDINDCSNIMYINQQCKVVIEMEVKNDVLILPKKAVFTKFSEKYVFVIKKDTALTIQVQTAEEDLNNIEVLNLPEGTSVVVEGQHAIYEGQKVKEIA